MSRLLVLLALLCPCPASAWGQTPPPEVTITRKALTEMLETTRSRIGVPALGAAIVTSKGLHAVSVVGVRKAGTKIKATEDDLWHLGSDSKAFTAMLLALLAEKGAIDLETPLEKAFPKMAK